MTTRAQDGVIDAVAARFGCCKVLPQDGTSAVLTVGQDHGADVDAYLHVTADGWVRRATTEEVRRAEQRARSLERS